MIRSWSLVDVRDYHASAVCETVDLATIDARWDAVAARAAADGWRLLGWRTYAMGDAPGEHVYRVTADLYRTADDVRSGALQLQAPML